MFLDPRPQRALQIAQMEGVKLVGENTFRVTSQSNQGLTYLVSKEDEDWKCECADFRTRHINCKHIYACSFLPSLKVIVRQTERPAIVVETVAPESCPFCQSKAIVKRGFAKEKAKNVQRFLCRGCKKTFIPNTGFKKMKNEPKAITAALDAYFRGLSLRDVKAHLEQFYGIRVNETSILRWIQKYSKVIGEYVNTLSPQLSDTWHSDEVFVKMRGGINISTTKQNNMAFLWNVMDRKTRFLLASKLSRHRNVNGAVGAFNFARNVAHDSEPEKIFADGLNAYPQAMTYWQGDRKPELVAKVGIKKPHANNNRIERMNGTVRKRTKVQRGLKSYQSSIPEGHRIYYNFLRPHMALAGQTPAVAAGIDLGLEGNRWITLIQKASENKRT